MIYSVKDWNNLYENNRTREMKSMQWVPVPNRHDGDGYTTLVDRENGAAYFGAWIAILQVASKCHPRGTLLREGAVPHDSASISRITRIPKKIIEEALQILVYECKWLIINEPQEGAENPQEGAAIPQATDEGKERKGIEENICLFDVAECHYQEKPDSLAIFRDRIGKWFKRRTSTKWSEKEEKALRKVVALRIPEDEWRILERYYTAEIPKDSDYRRRDIETLLNNFTGEIDRARRFQPQQAKRKGPNIYG